MSEKNGFIDGTGRPFFYQIRKEMVADLSLQLTDVLVFALLEDYLRFLKQQAESRGQDPDEVVLYPSRTWISEKLFGRVSIWTISKSLSRLREAGWLEATQPHGKTNHYILRDTSVRTEIQVACEIAHARCVK